MKQFARNLRKSSTNAELRLWHHLKKRNLGGYKFRRQHPIPPYVVDLVCLEKKLIVELDGGQHAEETQRDAARTAILESKGYRVIRFWNNDVLTHTEVVLEEVLRRLDSAQETPHPNPLSALGEREGKT